MLNWLAFTNFTGGQCYVLFDETPERDLEILRMVDNGDIYPAFLERPAGTAQRWVDEDGPLSSDAAWRRL